MDHPNPNPKSYNQRKSKSELEGDVTSIAFFSIFSSSSSCSECSQATFSVVSGIVVTALSLPATALRLAVIDALGAVSGQSRIGLRGAVSLRSGFVHVELMVELGSVVVVVVVQLVVVVVVMALCRQRWRHRGCAVEVLRDRRRSTVMTRWRVGRRVGAVQRCCRCWRPAMRRGVLWWDPYAT